MSTHDTTTPTEYDLTANDVAVISGCAPRTVRKWALRGYLPAVKLPGPLGAYRFRRADVEAMLTPGAQR